MLSTVGSTKGIVESNDGDGESTWPTLRLELQLSRPREAFGLGDAAYQAAQPRVAFVYSHLEELKACTVYVEYLVSPLLVYKRISAMTGRYSTNLGGN